MSGTAAERWHWFQFQTYLGKSDATSRWTKAHLFRADEQARPLGEPACAPFQNWRDPYAAGPRTTRVAPPRSPACRGCLFVVEHAEAAHGGDIGDVSFGAAFVLPPRPTGASPGRADARRAGDPRRRRA